MTKQKSDLSRAFSEDGAIKTHVGGQALIEGVMMRGKYNWAVAVREPDGAIYVEEHDLTSGKDKNGWMYWPLVRGCRALVESLMLGFKALEIAALHAFGDEEGEQKAAAEATDRPVIHARLFGLSQRAFSSRMPRCTAKCATSLRMSVRTSVATPWMTAVTESLS